jgi:hypothetical protein
MMLTHTLETKPTTYRDGWSRGTDGVLRLAQSEAFRLFSAVIFGGSPAALNLVYERGMEYEAFLAKNDITVQEAV